MFQEEFGVPPKVSKREPGAGLFPSDDSARIQGAGRIKMINFTSYEVLTFDCCGTLIDWEGGITAAFRPVLAAHRISVDDEQVLKLFAEIEPEAQEGEFVNYRQVLRSVARVVGSRLGFVPFASEVDCLVDSVENWEPFPDTIEALQALRKRFKLAIISNVDDDFFILSEKHLKVGFDWIITAEQAKSYKPSLRNFEVAIARIGVAPERILHVAQSMYHDILPAKSLGLSTVWVNRRSEKRGSGATAPAYGHPDLEVPDLKTLVSLIGQAQSHPRAAAHVSHRHSGR